MRNLETQLADSHSTKSFLDLYAEGQRYFMGQGSLNNTVARLTTDLKEHGIDYMVIGAVALLAHGYPRFTEDIDLVLTPEGLEAFHRELIGLGYVPAFPGARKRLRSTRDGVIIEVMTTGEYPGDGKPKPVSIPEPSTASTEIAGVQVVTFEKLIELKLASGMTAPHRLKDLADVQELIKFRGLQKDFAERLDPYVRDKFFELYEAVKQSPQDED
ncbi:MAG: nucleotidyltransferase family protein [Pyrinomonadaceae bacterium]|nr:nucleotidyltransferase family protein [Pyrinomonadaceae bacterium]